MNNREAFEAWFKKEHPFGNLEKSSNGGYKYIPAMVGWEAWQAALASQAQQTDSQWISVDELLPEMETPVVALVGKNVYALARVDYDEGWLWAICGCDLSDIRDYEADDDYQPTHWMYLSIPPAPEHQNDDILKR